MLGDMLNPVNAIPFGPDVGEFFSEISPDV